MYHFSKTFHSTGYKKIAVSTKPTASAFSFGQKHKDLSNNSVNGPGPAKYDITGLSNRGKYHVKTFMK